MIVRRLTLLLAFLVIGLGLCYSVSGESESVVCRGDSLTITAQLLENGSYGNPISYQNVEFFDETYDTYLSSVETDANGYASLEWVMSLNHPLGMTILNVTYRGNDSLNLWPSSQQTSVIVLSRTEMHVEIEKDNLSPGDELGIIVRLKNDLGMDIVGEKISVVHKGILFAETLTNSTGFATVSVECNSSWSSIGLNMIQIVYAGNWTSFDADVTRTIEFFVTKIPSSLELNDFNSTTLHLNDSAEVKITSLADNGILSDVQLDVMLDNNEFAYIQTNEFGIGILTFFVDSTITIGMHTLTVEYGGNERFEPSGLEIEFSVITKVMFDIVLSDSFVIDSTAYIDVRLFDYFDRNLTDLTLSLTDNVVNESTTLTMDSGGNYARFSIWVTAPKGRRTLILLVHGSPYIRDNNYSIELSVWVLPRIAIIESSVDRYAYPGQIVEMKLLIHNPIDECSNRSVSYSLDNGRSYSMETTDNYGLFALTVQMPIYECEINLQIVYDGSSSDYERPSNMCYVFIVTPRITCVFTPKRNEWYSIEKYRFWI
jgi:hypothetical protein